jgi:hypothetical protein
MAKQQLLDKLDKVKPAKTTADKKREAKEKIAKQHDFYKATVKNGDHGYYLDGIKFNPLRIIAILTDNGFYRYDLSVTDFIYIEVKDRIARQVSTQYIKDWFYNYVKSLPPYEKWVKYDQDSGEDIYYEITTDDILTAMLNGIDTHFKDSKLAFLKHNETIEFKTDDKTAKYLYYKNGWVKITKKGVQFEPDYKKLDRYVWHDQILPREFDAKYIKTCNTGDFAKFCYLISGDEGRFRSLQTIIGYLVHNYFEYKLYAIILTDSRIGEGGESNGRSGKGVLSRGIMNIVNNTDDPSSSVMVNINGKNFDFENDFRYSQVAVNTTLIHLEDVREWFNFELLFNDITEGIEWRKMYKDSVKKREKMLISSNKTIRIQGDSSVDRSRVFELTDYFNANRSPESEFKRWFFREWDAEQWGKFDAFMCVSIQAFFINDCEVLRPREINLNARMLIDHTSVDFIEFMDYLNFDDYAHANKVGRGHLVVDYWKTEKRYDKKDLYDIFLASYPEYRKTLKQKIFTKWIREYCRNHKYLKPIHHQDEHRSNGCSYVTFRLKDNVPLVKKGATDPDAATN